MTYLHVLLLLAPSIVWMASELRRRNPELQAAWVRGIALIAMIATIWTTPWDTLMVKMGVWTWSDEAVLALIGAIPLEEQLFFIVQPVLTGLWTALVVEKPSLLTDRELLSYRRCVAGSLAYLGASCLGILLWKKGCPYLGSMLVWFGVPLTVQCVWGWPAIKRMARPLAYAVALPSLLLVGLDLMAVQEGIWSFDASTMSPLWLGPLPIEEVIFFVTTNVLVVFGITLWVELELRLKVQRPLIGLVAAQSLAERLDERAVSVGCSA